MKTIELKHSFKISMESTTIIVENVQHRQLTDPIHTHSHGDQCYEIHYIHNGTGTLYLNNEVQKLSVGKMFLAGPFIKHAFSPDTASDLDEFYVYFNIKKLPETLDKMDSEWNTLISALLNNPFWYGEDKYNASVIMNELLNTALKKEFGHQTELKSLFLQFLIRLVKNILPTSYIMQERNTEAQHTSLHRIIENSFSKYNITLEQLASDLYLSQRQTERIVKSIYGKNFSQKKKEARMLAASDFLLSSDKSINEISEILLYSSVGHFSNQFSNYYGITPSQYRKVNRIR